ncbi:hypothetical protein HELRODRAFT_164694 [Helobdella robusta]|uniref:Uncharacterized protein n=1 Tax=Helobdella robusta TaxID=6412 RepID=T1EVQ5_HELRO|nr:hypothetical protein HELRODRAFT_164694 [Helobdella robusta]ESN92619.1 hypothetical protein HELRODRAFT_164694 [Helobdella robusta]
METENENLHNCNNNQENGDKVSSWLSVVTWFKSWLPERSVKLGEPNPKQKVAELIMCELNWQIKLAEMRRLEKEKEMKIQKTGVDYSWLVTNKPKIQSISEAKKLELEELCYRLDPDDCTEVIRQLWKASRDEPSATELPNVLQTIITNHIQEKQLKECNQGPAYNTNYLNLSTLSLTEWSRWVSSSVTNLFSQGGLDKISRNSSQELNSINSLEMVEMGVGPVDV